MPETAYRAAKLAEDATIAVFGHFGRQNLGDEATIQAVVENIRLRIPKARIVGLSLDPTDTAQRHGIPAHPIRRLTGTRSAPSTNSVVKTASAAKRVPNVAQPRSPDTLRGALKRIPLLHSLVSAVRATLSFFPTFIAEACFWRSSAKLLRHVDLLLITGSNQFLDNFGGPWGFPYTLLKWSFLAKRCGVKVVFLCVGAGPISSRLSKIMIRLALRCSAYCSFRDVRSQKLIQSLGYSRTTYVYPDLAFSLHPDNVPAALAQDCVAERRTVIGINPMPVFDERYWHIGNKQKYSQYLGVLASLSASLMSEGYAVVFWGTQPKDQLVIDDIEERLAREPEDHLDRCWRRVKPQSVDELLDAICGFDIVIATRFHGVILSLLAGKSIAAICYHQKMHDVMNDIGQGSYSIGIEQSASSDIMACVRQLAERDVQQMQDMAKRRDEYRKLLQSQYDVLFGTPIV